MSEVIRLLYIHNCSLFGDESWQHHQAADPLLLATKNIRNSGGITDRVGQCKGWSSSSWNLIPPQRSSVLPQASPWDRSPVAGVLGAQTNAQECSPLSELICVLSESWLGWQQRRTWFGDAEGCGCRGTAGAEPSAAGTVRARVLPAEGSPSKLIKAYPFIPDLTETTVLG